MMPPHKVNVFAPHVIPFFLGMAVTAALVIAAVALLSWCRRR